MKSKASIGGHPLHPMLILVPAGGVLFTVLFDLIHLASGDDTWWYATRPILSVALVGGVIAALPGLVDFVSVVPKGRPTGIALAHMGLNIGLLVAIGLNSWLRWHAFEPILGTPGIWLSLLAAVILGVSGWLGWTLVQKHHIGVLEINEGGDAPMLDGHQVVPIGLHAPDEVTSTMR